MQYEFKGKKYRIPDATIDKYIKAFDLSKDEAIKMYLEEENIIKIDEIAELTKQAKATKTAKLYVSTEKKKNAATNRPAREDEEKENIINELVDFLNTKGYKNVTIKNKTKLITFKTQQHSFKLDLIRTNLKLQERKNKKKEGI